MSNSKRKITASERRLIVGELTTAQRREKPHYNKLLRLRSSEVAKVIDSIDSVKGAEAKIKGFGESYMANFLYSLHRTEGYEFGGAALERFTAGTKATKPEWEQAVYEWSRKYAGRKITTMTQTMQSQMILWLQMSIQTSLNMGIEPEVAAIQSFIAEEWDKSKEWMVRRIVHTETLAAMSVGQYEAIKATKVPTTKQWCATFNNTREQHAVMDGVTIDRDALFVMPNKDLLLYPRDITNGATAENTINCQCGVIYRPKT